MLKSDGSTPDCVRTPTQILDGAPNPAADGVRYYRFGVASNLRRRVIATPPARRSA